MTGRGALLAAALGLTAAGCGGRDDGSSPEAAVRSLIAAAIVIYLVINLALRL